MPRAPGLPHWCCLSPWPASGRWLPLPRAVDPLAVAHRGRWLMSWPALSPAAAPSGWRWSMCRTWPAWWWYCRSLTAAHREGGAARPEASSFGPVLFTGAGLQPVSYTKSGHWLRCAAESACSSPAAHAFRRSRGLAGRLYDKSGAPTGGATAAAPPPMHDASPGASALHAAHRMGNFLGNLGYFVPSS